jgi:hypothetical protein
MGSSIPPPSDPAGSEPGEVFTLKDFRWWPVIVRRTPTAIQASFEVMSGGATVHAELVSAHDFSLFARHHEYTALASTNTAHSGQFQYMAEEPGNYRVIVLNRPDASDVQVSLVVRTEVNPMPAIVSTGASPQRQFVVIAASLTLFLGTVLWSGRRLLRAYRNR